MSFPKLCSCLAEKRDHASAAVLFAQEKSWGIGNFPPSGKCRWRFTSILSFWTRAHVSCGMMYAASIRERAKASRYPWPDTNRTGEWGLCAWARWSIELLDKTYIIALIEKWTAAQVPSVFFFFFFSIFVCCRLWHCCVGSGVDRTRMLRRQAWGKFLSFASYALSIASGKQTVSHHCWQHAIDKTMVKQIL